MRKRKTGKPPPNPIVPKILRMPQSWWDFLKSRKKKWGGNSVTDQLRSMVENEMKQAAIEAGKDK